MTQPEHEDKRIGIKCGGYVISRVIGSGGFGIVYEAHHPILKTRRAVKILRQELLQNSDAVRRFFREARIVANLDHPNIVDIHDVDKLEDGSPSIVMELLQGESLFERIQRRKNRLSLAEVTALMLDVCAALECAHENGVVHRDLKPANIFFHRPRGGDEVVKVLDFGVAKISDASTLASGMAQTNETLGTVEYMSPEQVKALPDVDHRADIYALGIILYELLTGRKPHHGTATQVIVAHITDEPEPVQMYRSDLHKSWAVVVETAMAKNRDERFANMLDVAAAIRAASKGKKVKWPTRRKRKQTAVGAMSQPTRRRTLPLMMAPMPQRAQNTLRYSDSDKPSAERNTQVVTPLPATETSPRAEADAKTQTPRRPDPPPANETAAISGPAAATMVPSAAPAIPTAAASAPTTRVASADSAVPDGPLVLVGSRPVEPSATRSTTCETAETADTALAAQSASSVVSPPTRESAPRYRLVLAIGACVIAAAVLLVLLSRGGSSPTAASLTIDAAAMPSDSAVSSVDASVNILAPSPVDATVPLADAALERKASTVVDATPRKTPPATKKPQYGKLTVALEPTWALVFVDGRKRGQTPLTIRLRAGWHRVTVYRKDLKKKSSRKVYVRGGRETVAGFDWRKK